MTFPLKPFFFLRHGQTDWNVGKIVMGQQDIPLNNMGTKQAYNAQEILKKIDVGNICASPLKRAHQTAQIIQEAFDIPLELYPGLMEHGWGKYEGVTSEKLDLLKKLPNGIEPGSEAESFNQFKARVLETMEVILNKTTLPPLIISHGGVFNTLVKELDIIWGAAENCVPYFFKPPDDENNIWNIYLVEEYVASK